MRIDQVALDLLEHDQEDHEPDGLHKRDRQDQQCTHDGADPCTQNGDQGRNADQDSDHRRIGHMEDQHSDKYQ